MINISTSLESDTSWNNRLLNSGYGTKNQLIEQAIHKKTDSIPYFLTFEDNSGNVVGQLLVSTFDRFSKKSVTKKILGKLSNQKQTLCQWEYGPIIFDPNYYDEVYTKLGEYLLSNKFFCHWMAAPIIDQRHFFS